MTTPDAASRLSAALANRYTIGRELGGGGMSQVFLAEETRLKRQVVIKLLPPELADAINAERFEREIQLAAKLQDPHIVPVLTVGEVGGLPYYIMPFVEGESLRARLNRAGTIPAGDAFEILRDVVLALEYAHRHGVVHRDIKPDNVLIAGRTAVVADFGIAKALAASQRGERPRGEGDLPATVTMLGMTVGTPAYMAPEQAAGDPNLDHRADIYSWGCLAYEMLTGKSPFAGRTPQATLAAQITELPAAIATGAPQTAPGLGILVMRCLAKNPDDRPQTATDLLRALDGFAGEQHPASSAHARHRFRSVGIVAALLVLALFAWAASWWFSPARHIERIAVLPLEDKTGESASLLSGAITGNLIQALTNAGLHVPGYRSVARYTPKDPLLPIAKTLKVNAVVSGEIFRKDGKIGIRLQVDDGVTGDALWSHETLVDSSAVSTLADLSADPLVSWMRPSASGAPLHHESARTTNPDAYRAYLVAANTAEHMTLASLRASVWQHRQVLLRDSNFAPSYAGVALALEIGFQYGVGGGPAVHDSAEVAIRHALQLDPDQAYAQAAEGMLLASRDWDWTHADESYRRAIASEPSPRVLALYSWFLGWWIGRPDSAVVVARRALALDDQAVVLHINLASRLQEAGQYDEARAEAIAALTLDSTASDPHRLLQRIATAQHQYTEASVELNRFEKRSGFKVPGFEAQVAVGLGHPEVAKQIEAGLMRAGPDDGSVQGIAYQLAITQLALGERDAALASLEQATRAHDYWAPFAFDWDPIRSEPRFQALVTQMMLPSAAHPVTKKP